MLLNNTPAGFYGIEWGYNVGVDAVDGKGVTLKLYAHSPGGDWHLVDSVFLEDDDNVSVDGLFTNHVDSRELSVTYKKRNFMVYKLVVSRKGNYSQSHVTVNSGYIKITRM
jgi:hypothetical protein